MSKFPYLRLHHLLFSSLQKNFSAILVLSVVAVLSCNAYVQGAKTASLLSGHEGLSIRGGQTKMAFTSDIPELRPPKSMYANVAELGATKASQSPIQTFILGILSGCHIAFGKRTIIKSDAPTQSRLALHIVCTIPRRCIPRTHCRGRLPRHCPDKSRTPEDNLRSIRPSFR